MLIILLSQSSFSNSLNSDFTKTPFLRGQFSKSHVRLKAVILKTCCMRMILDSVRLIWRKLRDITRSCAGVLNTGRSNVNFDRSRRDTLIRLDLKFVVPVRSRLSDRFIILTYEKRTACAD